MTDSASLVTRLNSIRWRDQDGITPEARHLIDVHVERIHVVVDHLVRVTGYPVAKAHGIALTPAHDTTAYNSVIDSLYENVRFENAGVREPLILTISASEVWALDPQLSPFPNPWFPLMELFQMGYPVSYEDAADMSSVKLLVGFRGGVQSVLAC